MAQSAMEAIDACPAKPSGPRNPWLAYAGLYSDPLGYLPAAARKHGDVAHIRIGRKSDFLLNHPDLIRTALLDHENLRRCVHRPLRRVLGTGLLTCRGERHKKQIGIAHVGTPVTSGYLVWRLLLDK